MAEVFKEDHGKPVAVDGGLDGGGFGVTLSVCYFDAYMAEAILQISFSCITNNTRSLLSRKNGSKVL